MVQLRIHQLFHWRLLLLISFFAVLLIAVSARVFTLAIFQHKRYVEAAERQQGFAHELPSPRGAIYATDKSGTLQPLAFQQTFYTLVATPKLVKDPALTARVVAEALGLAEDEVLRKVSKADDPFEIIGKKLTEDAAVKIRVLALPGMDLVEESRRVYPQGSLAASLLGFVSYGESEAFGAYGIERLYEQFLEGTRGFFAGNKSADGYWLALGKRILNPPVAGEDVVLTIDTAIQYRMEQELDVLMEKWDPASAAAMVIEPKTGRILALGTRPSFDPNAYFEEKDFSVFRTPLIDSQYELGSVFKPVTMAAGINEGVVKPSTTYEDKGVRSFGSYQIKNFDGKAHGIQTMTQVLEQSLNTGVIFVEERLGQERFSEYVERFGFGEKTGVDFPGEVAGDVSNLANGRDIDYATASFGQGIAVTPIQMAMAIGAIANGGVLMKPYVVDRIIDDAGVEERFEPEAVRRVITPEASETVSKMLVSVVRNGFENRAAVPGYFVAGKTGTAQIPRSDGRGYTDDVIHTFIGYAPAFDPRFLILLQMNKPSGNRFASNTLRPSFKELAEFIIDYYEIPPDEPNEAAGNITQP